MATVTPPYFFDEFLLPTRRKQPTPRERALGFTVKDLDWLHTLYYATETARTDLAAVTYPMKVERLLISAPVQTAIPIAGAFMMSPTPDDDKAVLYTPYGGLEVFENRAVLLSEVQERLKQPSQRTDLLGRVQIQLPGAGAGASREHPARNAATRATPAISVRAGTIDRSPPG